MMFISNLAQKLFMGTEDLFLKTIFAIVLLTILIIYLRKFLKKQRTELSKNDILKFTTELMAQLKDFSQKTSADGQRVQVALEDLSFARLQEWCTAIRGETLASLEEDHKKTAKKFEELEKTIENFGKETLLFRESLERVTKDEEFYENEMRKRLVQISMQTGKVEGDSSGEVVEESSLEALYNETCNVLLLAIKDCMDQIVIESKWNLKNNPALEISTFVKQQYKNLEELLNFIINERQLQNDILSVETEGMEKQLLDIFIFLDRKFVDVQAIKETLKFFNRKFINFANKCETKWDHSCSGFDATRDLVYEAKDNLIFSCSKMSRISCSLIQQTGDLGESVKILEEAVRKTTAIAEAEALRKPSSKRMEEVFGVIENMKGTLSKIEEEYCLKLRAISESLETPSQRLESFVQYVEELELFDDLVKNIAKKYEGTMTYTSVCERGDNNRLQDVKDIETSSMISGDGLSSYQFGEGFSELSFEVSLSKNDKSDLSKQDSSRETRKNFTLRRMQSVLGEVIKKTAEELVEKEQFGSLKRNLSSKRKIDDKLGQKSFDWTSVPSEDSLSDTNKECLVRSSSSEDEEKCNM